MRGIEIQLHNNVNGIQKLTELLRRHEDDLFGGDTVHFLPKVCQAEEWRQ